jgi:hypothetical protein
VAGLAHDREAVGGTRISALRFLASAALRAVCPAATNCRDSVIHFPRSLAWEPSINNRFPEFVATRRGCEGLQTGDSPPSSGYNGPNGRVHPRPAWTCPRGAPVHQ